MVIDYCRTQFSYYLENWNKQTVCLSKVQIGVVKPGLNKLF